MNQHELNHVHNALYVVLQKLTTELEKAGIPYWLDFGTCLGAIRQQDFIPWDDDIDLALLRNDDQRLIQLLSEKLSDLVDISVQTPNKPIAVPIKLELKGLHVIENKMEANGIPNWLHPNIGIDIFFVDPRKNKPTQIMRIYRIFLSKIWQAKQMAHFVGLEHPKSLHFIKKAKYRIASSIPRRLILKLIKLEIKKNVNLEESKFIVHGVDSEFAYLVHESKEILPLKKILFRGGNFASPNEPYCYLKGIYGDDFIQPPTNSKRLTHSAKLLIASNSPFAKIDPV